jgi:predicted negative regulator of RcsB-dependent stress response
MAAHYDLEEQEQLAQIKHFWSRWGNLISWVLIVVMSAYAAWNGWQWWQHRNAAQAAILYDTVEQSAKGNDLELLQRSLADIQSRFPSAVISHHAALLAAKTFEAKGQIPQASQALTWVADKSPDEGLSALARLRLAGLQIQGKDWPAAKATLTGHKVPASFQWLFDERLGDLAQAQGQSDEARDAYLKAWQAAPGGSDGRRWIEIKLAAMGVQPQEKP